MAPGRWGNLPQYPSRKPWRMPPYTRALRWGGLGNIHKARMGRLATLKSTLTLKPATLHTLTHRPGATERLRGSAAVSRRERYLKDHPLCCRCQAKGLTEVAVVVDHIIPLWAGGSDNLDSNGQPLCKTDHDAKSACEARMRAAGGWMATPCTCGQH